MFGYGFRFQAVLGYGVQLRMLFWARMHASEELFVPLLARIVGTTALVIAPRFLSETGDTAFGLETFHRYSTTANIIKK